MITTIDVNDVGDLGDFADFADFLISLKIVKIFGGFVWLQISAAWLTTRTFAPAPAQSNPYLLTFALAFAAVKVVS